MKTRYVLLVQNLSSRPKVAAVSVVCTHKRFDCEAMYTVIPRFSGSNAEGRPPLGGPLGLALRG